MHPAFILAGGGHHALGLGVVADVVRGHEAFALGYVRRGRCAHGAGGRHAGHCGRGVGGAAQLIYRLGHARVGDEVYLVLGGGVGDLLRVAMDHPAGVRLLLEGGGTTSDVRRVQLVVDHVQDGLVRGQHDAALGDDHVAGVDAGADAGVLGVGAEIRMIRLDVYGLVLVALERMGAGGQEAAEQQRSLVNAVSGHRSS